MRENTKAVRTVTTISLLSIMSKKTGCIMQPVNESFNLLLSYFEFEFNQGVLYFSLSDVYNTVFIPIFLKLTSLAASLFYGDTVVVFDHAGRIPGLVGVNET